jgi:uncharacterized membrane protein
MVDNKQIEQWLHKGIINSDQAARMIADTSAHQTEESSSKFIVAISTIGSILLGVGAILFIASNWDKIPDTIKTLLLIGCTFSSYYAGYYFKYQAKNLPKVGSSLMFLATMLFGATLFLLAQIYHVQANNDTLVLIWLIGVLPLIYAFASVEMAGLATLLFYAWITLYVLHDATFSSAGNYFKLPVLYLVSGVSLFGIGGIHYFSQQLKRVARVFRLAGIQVAVFSLFLLTFRFFSGNYDGYNIRGEYVTSDNLAIMIVGFAIVAAITLFINMFFNPSKSQTPFVEFYTGLPLAALALLFFYFPADSNIYVILFNLALAGIIFVLLQQGYKRRDIEVVNIGLGFFVILLISRYFDFFWGLLDRSLFFIIGGIVLLLGGIALERKRKQIKAQFTASV